MLIARAHRLGGVSDAQQRRIRVVEERLKDRFTGAIDELPAK
jgi:hypothetical protein